MNIKDTPLRRHIADTVLKVALVALMWAFLYTDSKIIIYVTW